MHLHYIYATNESPSLLSGLWVPHGKMSHGILRFSPGSDRLSMIKTKSLLNYMVSGQYAVDMKPLF